MMKQKYFFLYLCLLASVSLQAMVFDVRYGPFFQKPFTRYCNEPCRLIIQPFTMLAHHSWTALEDSGNSVSKEEGPLFSGLYGFYNQVAVDNALQQVGLTSGSLFRSDMLGVTSIPWYMRGRFEGHGLAIQYDQSLTNHFGFGFSALAMQVNSRMEMGLIAPGGYPVGDVNELYQIRNKMCCLEDITPGIFKRFDFGDIDFYLRFGALKEYCYKFRKIDIGMRLGVLIPTARRRVINNPASFSIGGNRHWGMYAAWDTELEVKEDLKIGLWVRTSWRFANTSCERVPLAGEPDNFGVLKTQVKIHPGLTAVFMPYFALEGLRDGFGLKFIYTIVHHSKDSWSVCKDRTISVTDVACHSGWASEYLTVDLMYDFAKDKEYRRFSPCVSLAVDIPLNFLIAKRSFKTFGVSCLIQTDF